MTFRFPIFALLGATAAVAGAHAFMPAPGQNAASSRGPAHSPATTAVPSRAPALAAPDPAASAATRLPVPLLLVGGRAAAPAARAPWEEPLANGDAPPPGTMTEAAARAAIEADGYKAVRALSRGPNGAWQARALRGSTEVQLSVDRAGGVSAN